MKKKAYMGVVTLEEKNTSFTWVVLSKNGRLMSVSPRLFGTKGNAQRSALLFARNTGSKIKDLEDITKGDHRYDYITKQLAEFSVA